MSQNQDSPWMAIAAIVAFAVLTVAQQPLSAQNDTFASANSITPEQQLQAGINDTVRDDLEVALNFERSNWATGSVDADPFYGLPSNTSSLPAGSLLKVQVGADTSAFTLPPDTALSRILYQTKTLNGSVIPASAYVLWPYSPRTESDGLPVVGWAHGTSGGFGESPYTLALQGYVVVAPDYAGLGVDHDLERKVIRHPYTANPSHANDLFFSVQAAQSAFTSLSKRFILMGHSQGGGAAWGAAQRQALQPVEGYLGAVAGSPVTNVHDLIQLGGVSDGAVGMLIANGLPDIFPSFNASAFLTAAGLKLYALVSEIQGCNSVVSESFFNPELYEPAWYDNVYARLFFNLTANGGQPIGGPMLVLQGEADPEILPPITDQAVNLTCAKYPRSQLQYLTYAGVTHIPVLYASQVTWLDWIADRFAGESAPEGYTISNIASFRPPNEYQLNPN